MAASFAGSMWPPETTQTHGPDPNGTDAPQVDEWCAYVRRSNVPAPPAP